MVYVVPLVCVVPALIAAHVAARRGYLASVAVATLALCVLTAWLVWKGRQLSGWDGIGYGIAAGLMCLPAILGSGIGTLTGLYRRRRDGHEAAHDDQEPS